jgi:hypothetical protein
MKSSAAALLLLLSASAFGSPAPALNPEFHAELAQRDAEIVERDNVIVARDIVCWVSKNTPCMSSRTGTGGTKKGTLTPRPATFGASCQAQGRSVGGTTWHYYVPAYGCWVTGSVVSCQSKFSSLEYQNNRTNECKDPVSACP